MDELGADPACLSNDTPKDDFGGGHADPNLTYAKDLVKALGLTSKGAKNPEMEGKKVCVRMYVLSLFLLGLLTHVLIRVSSGDGDCIRGCLAGGCCWKSR